MQENNSSFGQEHDVSSSEIVREAFLIKGVPKESIDLLSSSISTATLKQYNRPLKEWYSFTKNKGYDTFHPTTNTVLEFLSKKFSAGASYDTLNSARGAISLISVNDISKDSVITRFFKGVYRQRPTKLKYSTTWNTDPVFEYIENLPPVNELTPAQISEKTATLLALVTAHHLQTLALINIKNIVITESNIEIKIPDLIKTSKPGSVQPSLILYFLPDRLKICPGKAILDYLDFTKENRTTVENLFISVRKLYKSVCSQTLGHWVKSLLSKSGIDMNKFTAYSTRQSSVSSASKRGVDISTIRRTAGWSNNSKMFARFYNLPIQESNVTFGLSVLQQNAK